MAKSIAVIGTEGTNSTHWIGAFLSAGWEVRSLVRDPTRVLPHPNQAFVRFDLDDFTTFEAALAGVDVLGLVSPADPRQVEREGRLIEAAKRVGMERVVKVSVIGAERATPISQFARWSHQVENTLRSAAVPHVVLRANLYMQNLLRQRDSILKGQYVEPLADSAVTLLDVRDVADAAVVVAGGRFDGRALILTGAEALTGSQMADTLSAALGQPVRFVSPDLHNFGAALAEKGVPAWRRDSLVELYSAIQDGLAPHLALTSSDFTAITGKPPRTFRRFAQEAFGFSVKGVSEA